MHLRKQIKDLEHGAQIKEQAITANQESLKIREVSTSPMRLEVERLTGEVRQHKQLYRELYNQVHDEGAEKS